MEFVQLGLAGLEGRRDQRSWVGHQVGGDELGAYQELELGLLLLQVGRAGCGPH